MVNLVRLEIVFTNVLKIMEVADEDHARGEQLLKLTFDQFTITTKGDHVMYKLPADHTVLMQVAYTDANGNPATIDGVISWESSDEGLVTAMVDPADSTICRAVPAGGIGQAQITATCDADIGEGVRELVTLCDIEIVGGEAVAGMISPVGEPEPVGVPDQGLPVEPGGQQAQPQPNQRTGQHAPTRRS
jgi:hypothetical protein